MPFMKDSGLHVSSIADVEDRDAETLQCWQPGVNKVLKTECQPIGSDDSYLKQLRALPPFCYAPDMLLDRALKSARLREASAGSVLVQSEEEGRDYLALIQGELEICRSYLGLDGAEEIHLGRVVSDSSQIVLVHALPRLTAVRAVTAARVLHIDGGRVEELLAWSQRFAGELRDLAPLRARMNLLGQVGPFQYLPLDNVQQALEALIPIDMEAGQQILRQGESGEHYYLIEHGSAEVWRTDPLTDELARVAVLGPGDAFGEEALLVDGFRNATVTMTVRGRLWVLGKADFDALVKPQIVAQVEAARAYAMVNRKEARWLDCRYDIEFEESHLAGALHLPLDRLRELAHTLDRQTPYIVYCRSGRRSTCAAYLLRERGYRTYSLTGGICEWPYAVES